jgi:hypothetical protein
MDAIKFATMYLDGKAHDWWYHGLTTLGHNQITSYTEFTQRLIDRFDQGDPELPFRELTQLRQTGSSRGLHRRVPEASSDGTGCVSSETYDALHRRVDGTLEGLGQGF